MDILKHIAAAGQAHSGSVIAWGEVTGVSPTLVRFAGDTGDTQVTLRLSSYTATTNDRVVLLKVGTSWAILGKLV